MTHHVKARIWAVSPEAWRRKWGIGVKIRFHFLNLFFVCVELLIHGPPFPNYELGPIRCYTPVNGHHVVEV